MAKETTKNLLLKHLASATRWMSTAELSNQLNRSSSTVRRQLRGNQEFKSEKLPGDNHGARQWAISSADTTNFLSAPIHVGTSTSRISSKNPPLSMLPRSLPPATYQGMTLMCAPSNKPSLIKAVGDLLVNEFVTSGNKFSAYDITKRLRNIELDRAKNATRNTPLAMPTLTPVDRSETGETFVAGYRVPKIEHDDVRNIVHDIYNAGGMPNLGRIQISNYWVYDIKANIDALFAASQATPGPVIVVPLAPSSPDPDPADGVPGSSYDGTSTV